MISSVPFISILAFVPSFSSLGNSGFHCISQLLFYSPNSFSYRGSYISSWGVRVRRFCGFVAGGAVTQGVVRGVFGVCRGQGSAVTKGVVGGVVWCVGGCGFADPIPGCRHTECHESCHRMRVGVRVCRFKRGLSQRVSGSIICSQVFLRAFANHYGKRSILWIGLKQIAETRCYLSMLFGSMLV